MTVVGLDDTDSPEGMCTTYVAATAARRLRERGHRVERLLLVRLNPAVAFKTRGNAALAVHTDAPVEAAFQTVRDVVDAAAETGAPETNPGVVAAGHAPGGAAADVADFARAAVRDYHDPADARTLAEREGFRVAAWDEDRGVVGALAAAGAWTAFEEWTVEHVAYRERERWGTPREVDADSVFAAAEAAYPAAWDTVDRGEREAVCVPHTPGPLLYGVRGDDRDAVEQVAAGIRGEEPAFEQLFYTNQGTDAHLRDGSLAGVEDGYAYRVTGTVAGAPETRAGGHVFVPLRDGDATLPCAAFEPTKRFRDRVRALRPGDRVTACGEVARGTLKLEKFAVRDLVREERVTPTCPACERSMESAGAGQGYRCRDCGTAADGKATRELDRSLDVGWYEVPPCARRHVSKPLVRGGFDAPVHPER